MSPTELQIIIAVIGIAGSVCGAFFGYWLGFLSYSPEIGQ